MTSRAAFIHSPLDPGLDRVLLSGVVALLLFGLVMVTSASLQIAQSELSEPFYYSLHHGAYLLVSMTLALAVFIFLPLELFERTRFLMLPLMILALTILFIPGLGQQANGSLRWIALGPFTVQSSEIVKPAFVLYLAGYIARHKQALQQDWSAFAKPLAVFAVIAFLLLLQPNFGAVLVLAGLMMSMLFLAGVPALRFLIVALAGAGLVAGLAFAEPYRVERLLSFLDPWDHQFGSGYQLTQSLIAFGRGHWSGVGLGESVQKLFYLPEAHTDFVYAVVAEELGLLGNLALIGVFGLVLYRMFRLARRLDDHGSLYSAFVVYGITIVLCTQTVINMGVNMGLLPTKGLTLPFVSYGGSSLLASLFMVALVLRAAVEYHHTGERRRSS